MQEIKAAMQAKLDGKFQPRLYVEKKYFQYIYIYIYVCVCVFVCVCVCVCACVCVRMLIY